MSARPVTPPDPTARFKNAATGEWLDDDQWPKVRHTVVCHTKGCPAFGVPFTEDLNEQVDGVFRSDCGPCGQPHAERRKA